MLRDCIYTTPEKEKTDKSNKRGIICLQPFIVTSFCFNGDVFNRICGHRIKYNIGNIKGGSIAELWNSDTARWIRRKMYEGKWQDICKPICPVIIDYLRLNKFIKYEELDNIKLLTPAVIKNVEILTPKLISEIKAGKTYLKSPPAYFNPATSGTCNLNCLMCNAKQINDDPVVQKKLWLDLRHYLPTAKAICLTGLGDPFARPDARELLINYKGLAKFHIITNGLLLPKYWEQIKHQKFASLNISIDAALKETYEKIRVGGKWKDLLKTLELVKQKRDKFESIVISMTVMRSNYREIPRFIDFAESHGFDCLFQSIRGKHGNENIFELNDTGSLDELKKIVAKESSEERDINIAWED